MRLHRFIYTCNLRHETLRIHDADFFNQVTRVLRLKKGESLILCDGSHQEMTVTIEDFDSKSVVLKSASPIRSIPPLHRDVTLYCAMLKKENFEWVAQKATELGISRLVPLITARTVKLNLPRERIMKIMHEAAEQSGRGSVPVLQEPIALEEALPDMEASQTFVCDMSGSPTPHPRGAVADMCIGPEGGWDASELALMRDRGLTFVSLSRQVLRAETAAIVSVHWALEYYPQ